MDTAQVDQLRSLVQRLFRKFGTLGAGATPCGKPLSIAHAHALMVLAHGELTQQELAAKLCIDKSNVARLCAKLVEAGHAKQASGARDRRSRVVALTPAGQRLARDVDAASRQRFAALLSGMNASRRQHVIDGLSQLVAAIDAAAEPLEEDEDAAQ